MANTQDESCAYGDEENDGDHFDHGEPIFETAEAANVAGVDVEQGDGEDDNPEPLRSVWEPPLAIDSDGRGFAANRNALRRPIGVAHGEAGPLAYVDFGIDSE